MKTGGPRNLAGVSTFKKSTKNKPSENDGAGRKKSVKRGQDVEIHFNNETIGEGEPQRLEVFSEKT